jgi:hypothetical protein
MHRRALLLLIPMAPVCFAAGGTSPLRGKLTQQPGKPPAIETEGHQLVLLTGDKPTEAILKDKRLAGMEFEVMGHFSSQAEYAVDPIEKRALLVHKDNKIYRVTYYCDVCSIRTYFPGPCMCCQEETRLDLIDPNRDI